MILDTRYVFHIPLCKYQNNKLIPIGEKKNIRQIIDSLLNRLTAAGYFGMYILDAEGVYKERRYNEKLIILYTETGQNPELVFEEWFAANNDILKQECYSYEKTGKMIIKNL